MTPENTRRVLASEPLYAADTDDPNFMAPAEIRALQNRNLRRQLERVMEGSAEKTLERIPDGEVGLLVITHLNRTGTVLLRYVVGDYAAITHEPCPLCGRTGTRTQIAVGSTYATRTGDLVNLKGTLINPEILMYEIANTAGIAEYQVVFTKRDPADPYSPDELVIRVGKLPDRSEKDIEDELQQRLQSAVETRGRIEFAELSEIFDPDVSFKAARLVDLRPGE